MGSPDPYRELVQAVEAVEVYLLHSTAKRTSQIAWPLQVETDCKLEEPVEREGPRVAAPVSARVTGRPGSKTGASDGEQPADPHFSMEMTWRVVYTLSRDLTVADEIVRQFLQRNVVLNVWPYIREYVSSVTARMNLPVLYLPVVRFLR